MGVSCLPAPAAHRALRPRAVLPDAAGALSALAGPCALLGFVRPLGSPSWGLGEQNWVLVPLPPPFWGHFVLQVESCPKIHVWVLTPRTSEVTLFGDGVLTEVARLRRGR